jgi:mono/diheme cytochrome c family protein
LRDGFHPDHGTARGPMAEVVSNLSAVSASDVHAIATYMADVFGEPSPVRRLQGETVRAQAKQDAASPPESEGAKIYAAACAGCHDGGRAPPYGGIHLGLSTAISTGDPRNLANIVLSGVRPVEGERSPIMPGFAGVMNDRDVAALLGFLRLRFGRQPAWSDLEQTVAEARRTQTAYVQNSAAPNNAPADPAQRDKP